MSVPNFIFSQAVIEKGILIRDSKLRFLIYYYSLIYYCKNKLTFKLLYCITISNNTSVKSLFYVQIFMKVTAKSDFEYN